MDGYPVNAEAETAIIAVCISPEGQEYLPKITTELMPADFNLPEHIKYFDIICSLYKTNSYVDIPAVYEEIKRRFPEEKQSMAILFIEEMKNTFFQLYALDSYIKTIKDVAARREIILKLETINTKLSNYQDMTEIASDIQTLALRLTEKQKHNSLVNAKEAVEAYKRELEELEEGISKSVSTGLKDLDDILGGGFKAGDLIVVGARTSHGKTIFVSGMALNLIKKGGVVIIFATEIRAARLIQKLVSQKAKINNYNLKFPGALKEVEKKEINEALTMLKESDLYIDEAPRPTIAQIFNNCLKVKTIRQRIDLVIIDYIQRVGGQNTKDSRYEELSKISGDLKTLAQELSCPVIVTSQLNRQVELRQGKRPTIADLRDCGRIEEEADVAILLYRPERYDAKKYPGEVEIIIEKNRDGEVGSLWSVFQKEYTLFRDKAKLECQI
jgi:replicative DNA helicase